MMKVSLFITCMADIFAYKVGKATVELLEYYGCDVEFPEAQTCCGQPAYNSGYKNDAKKAMRHMIDTFESAQYVVAPSGSCITMFRAYPEIFKDDPVYYQKATNLANKSYELTQFLYEVLEVRNVPSTFKGTVTYHPSCHMTRLLRVKEAPLRLLESIPGVTLVPLPQAEDCCGFGGTFAVKNDVISGCMVDEKARHVEETEADVLTGGDLACLMNIAGRLTRRGAPVEVKHIAEILNDFPKGGDR